MLSRRKFLSLSSLAIGSSAFSLASLASGPVASKSVASRAATSSVLTTGNHELKLLNLHTGERLAAHYCQNGQYQNDALEALDHFFRDHRNDQVTRIDTQLLDSISSLQAQLGYDKEIHIISGYRSPETNDKLLQQGRKVAKRSLHLQGRAIDLRLPGLQLSELHRAALAHHKGGVGYYARSNFIHLDTGRQRRWG